MQEASTDLNPIWVTLEQNLKQSQANSASLQASQAVIGHQVEETRQELTDMVNNGLVIDRLQRQVDNDKDAYTAYVRKSEEARAAQGLNLNKILNVSLAQAPTQPMSPVFPVIWLNLLAGAVTGRLRRLGSRLLGRAARPQNLFGGCGRGSERSVDHRYPSQRGITGT